ncbi:MAG: NADP-dependent phosphogluconate dehydrogenase [Bacteroidia bacterium]|nr:NADP-dependent phosphogluconate dehydrogenase [Bacteroidia bacterium]
MGVSGSGKTTIGQNLSKELNLPFYDADAYHPKSNIEKMASDMPLDDDDRLPWLKALNEELKSWNNSGGAVLACSALKESYRQVLSADLKGVVWIVLNGEFDTIKDRMTERTDHFMEADMLMSQFDAFEIPDYGLHIQIDKDPQDMIDEIIKRLNPHKSQLGIIGLGVMGSNLSKNAIGKGLRLSVFNRDEAHEKGMVQDFIKEYKSKNVSGYTELSSFVESIETPRIILMMIKAGNAIDSVLSDVLPLLNENDVIIDGGNSFYEDTERRIIHALQSRIHFLGMGVSGGASGALNGPSLMPGGAKQAYDYASKVLAVMAAKDKDGKACVGYIGKGGSGHFVKMVHNGIEYAEMQLLAELYGFLRSHYSNEEIAELFESWSSEACGSYLLDISIDILRKRDDEGGYIIDQIRDTAGSKGTGNWSARVGLKLNSPITMIHSAVHFRMISALRDGKKTTHQNVDNSRKIEPKINSEILQQAYQAARLLNHYQGFELLKTASTEHNWDLDLAEIARIWTRGCIIRSTLMDQLSELLKKHRSIIDYEPWYNQITNAENVLQEFIKASLANRVAVPCFSSALNYWLAFTSESLPTNLIQAQRDYFGGHGYQRIDEAKDKLFYTNWG